MEKVVPTGVAHDRSEAKVAMLGVPDDPSQAARMSHAVTDAEVSTDMVLQNISTAVNNRTDTASTCPREGAPRAMALLKKLQADNDWKDVPYDDHTSKVSLVSTSIKSYPGVAAALCEALASEGVNIDLISISEIRISVLVNNQDVDESVKALYNAFNLGGDTEAVVYADTRR